MAAADNERQGASLPAIGEAPTQDPSGGYPCPFCASRTNVTNSRPVDGSIRRRRMCPTCGFRLSTVETPVGDLDDATAFKRHILPRLLELRRWLNLLDDFKDPR